MGSIFPRGRKLWVKFKDAAGKWVNASTGLDVGQEQAARALLAKIQDRILAGESYDPGPITVAAYAKQWVRERKQRNVANVVEDETRLRLHILPALGRHVFTELRPRHIRDLLRALQAPEADRAPRTVRNIFATIRKMCNDAVVDEVIEVSPCKVKGGDLPKNVDKDPSWREQAVFTGDEIEALISDDRIPLVRRVYYAMQALAGPRAGSGLARRWRHYDTTTKPLGKLAIVSKYSTRRKKEEPRTKSGASIYVPVHPTLAAMLAEWKLKGWEAYIGRKPTAEDLIVPKADGSFLRADSALDALHHDLATLGLRKRRQHDLRRSFVSLARAAGARKDVVEWMSHGPRGDIVDMYTTLPWELLCEELVKLNVRQRLGQVVRLPRVSAAGALVHPLVQPQGVVSPSQQGGGSARELNPPTRFLTPFIGFEEREPQTGLAGARSVSGTLATAADCPSTVPQGYPESGCTKRTKPYERPAVVLDADVFDLASYLEQRATAPRKKK